MMKFIYRICKLTSRARIEYYVYLSLTVSFRLMSGTLNQTHCGAIIYYKIYYYICVYTTVAYNL